MTPPTVSREALRAAVAIASARVFDVDVDSSSLYRDVPPEEVVDALGLLLDVVLEVASKPHWLGIAGRAAAREGDSA